MKRSRHIFTSVSLASSILITSMAANFGAHFPAHAADGIDTENSATSTSILQNPARNSGDTGVVLQRFEDGSIGIQGRREISSGLRMNDLFFTSDTRVVKIGDSFTKGKSIEQLTQLLQGSIGSSIPVTLFIGAHATIKSLVLHSADELRGKRDLINAMSLGHNVDLYTDWNGPNRDVYRGLGKNDVEQGNILCATSAYIAGTEPLPFHFAAFYDDNLAGLGDALDFYARTGMFARFDTALKTSMDASSQNVRKYTDDQCAALIRCANSLTKYGYTAEGKLLLDRLYEPRQNFSAENKVKLLLGRARLAQQQGDTSVALNAYNELTDTCLSSAALNPEVQNSALIEVVAYSISQKEAELAVKAQLRLNECAGSPPGFRSMPSSQQELGLTTLLADAYDLADHKKAIETLQKALTTYERNATRDDATLANRIFTVCPASVRFKIAYLCARDGRRDEAKKYFEAGAKFWSEDLGSDPPYLAEIKDAERAFAKEPTEQNNTDLLASLAKLPGAITETQLTSSTDRSIDKQSYKRFREVYDAAIAGKGDVATQLLDPLIKQEFANSHHNSLDVARLVNLVSASRKAIGLSKVEEFLNHLATLFSKSDSLIEPAALYVRTEGIVLRDPKTETAQWESFDSYITDIAEASGFSANGLDDPNNRIRKLFEISYSYAIRKEPAKALKFLEYAKAKYPAATENMRDFIAYEMTLQCLLGNKAEAEKSLDTLFAIRVKRGTDPRFLATVAATFANAGNRTASLRVLESTGNSPQDTHTNKQLAFYRALVYYKFGNYKDALAELSDYRNTMLSGQTINELRRLRAESFVHTGELDSGIQALCETAGDGMIVSLAFERALELAKAKKGVSDASIANLLDFSSRTRLGVRGVDQDTQLAQALKELLKLAQEHQCPPAKISSLQQRLGIDSTSGAASGATTTQDEAASKAEPSFSVAARARELVLAKKYEEGCAMFLRALQMDDAASFNRGMYHYGNLKGDLCVQVLTDAKQFDGLERILDQALKTRLSSDLKLEQNQKTFAVLEKTFLCEMYLEQGKYDDAKKWADETVKAFKESNRWYATRRSAQDSASHAENISLVRQFINKKQFDTARALLDQLDGILATKVGPKHVLWIEDKLARAQLLEAEGKLSEAEKIAKDALDLDTWTNGTKPTAHRTRSAYASILREEGKTDAADAAEAITFKEFKYDGRELYGSTFGSSFHSPPPTVFTDTAEAPLKQFLDNHMIEHGEGSAETQAAMDDLARFYVQKQRWDDAEKIQLRELKILDQMFGQCLEPKQSCFLNLSEIYKGKNDKKTAIKYANQIKLPIESKFRDGSEYVSMLRLASVLFFIGKKDEAIAMGKTIEEALSHHMGWWRINERTLFDDCIAFMRSAGANDDGNSLEAEKIKRLGPNAATRIGTAPSSPSAEERQKDRLEKSQKELSAAESIKEKQPMEYLFALLNMFTASIERRAIRDAEPQDAEKYFLRALEFFQQYAPKSDQPDRLSHALGTLWSNTRWLSAKTFSSVFDQLCQCSKWIDEREYRSSDNAMMNALRSRERTIRETEKKQFLQRAIDIRKADSGVKSKKLGTLYLSMASCCEQLGDINGAEKSRLDSLGLEDDKSGQIYQWIDIAHFYGRVHKADKEEAAWRKALEIANKNNLEFNARSWISLIKQLQNEGHTVAADEITNSLLLARPDANTLHDLDKYLVDRIDGCVASQDLEKASSLIKKRLNLPSAGSSERTYLTDWQVRLSNVYLAQGKEKESQDLFNRIIASLALQARPTDELRRDRAVLLKNLGKNDEAQKLNATVPKTTGAVVISSPMMAKELIRFGHNSLISSFDSSQPNNAPGSNRPQFNVAGMRGDPTTIICEGLVTHESNNILFGGKIACRQSDFEKTGRWDIISVPAGVTMNDAVQPPQSATKYLPNSSTEGDYQATDFVETGTSRAQNSSRMLRLFLQDSPGKNEFEGSRGGYRQNSYQQVQVWYNGTKPIKIQDFAGLLYAPHAPVQIEFNGRFRGALVARQILLEGNNHIELDRGIVGKEFSQ